MEIGRVQNELLSYLMCSYKFRMAPKIELAGGEGEGTDKAKWYDKRTEVFLKICVEEILAGNRPSTHFTKDGWRNLERKFHERTGHAYSRIQLKNKWDSLKREFSLFAKLVKKETDLRWDHKNKTIQAPQEWWASKGKENPVILKWKEGGPKFLNLMEKCFKGVVAYDFVVLAPCQNPSLDEGVNIYDEDEGDSDEAGHGVQQVVDDFNVGQSSLNSDSKKRKRQSRGEKRVGVPERLQVSLDHTPNETNEESQTTVTIPDPYSYYICLKMLSEVPGLVKGSARFFLAIRILVKKEHREAFVYFMKNDPELTIGWLNTFSMADMNRF